MLDRCAGIETAITRSAAPAANSLRASSSTPAGRVRSPMPISTQPFPMTSTSPPSSCAGPPSRSLHVSCVLAREQRVVAVDRVEVDRLAAARRLRHLVDGHAAVHPRRRVAREEVIRKRREHEAVERGGLRGKRAARERQLVVGDAADQPLGELSARQRAEPLARPRGRGVGPSDRLVGRALEDQVAGRRDVERLAEQLVQVEHLDAALDKCVRERVVLLPGAPHPEHVVEQQLVLVPRRKPLQLQVRPVENHPAQAADLRADVQPRGGGRRRRERAHRALPASSSSGALETGAGGVGLCRACHHFIAT